MKKCGLVIILLKQHQKIIIGTIKKTPVQIHNTVDRSRHSYYIRQVIANHLIINTETKTIFLSLLYIILAVHHAESILWISI